MKDSKQQVVENLNKFLDTRFGFDAETRKAIQQLIPKIQKLDNNPLNYFPILEGLIDMIDWCLEMDGDSNTPQEVWEGFREGFRDEIKYLLATLL